MKQKICSQQMRLRVLIISACFIALPQASCVKQSHQIALKESLLQQTASIIKTQSININTATQDELEKLPLIGKSLAARIIEHRQLYGRFRRAEHLILVKGMSDKKFRALREVICVE